MNSLQDYLAGVGADEAKAMDALQDAGIISDNCVWARDVAEADCPAAVEFLKAAPQ